MKNHFIIIGTAKSGSSTLYEYLKEHPKTQLSNIKEHNFFMDIGYNWNSSLFKIYRRKLIFGLGYYNEYFRKKVLERYRMTSHNAEGFYSGDGSINYFYSKEVPKRIQKYVPNAKLILLLRNPIDRVYSNYWMNTKQNIPGWKYKSFEDFMESEAFKSEINLYSISLKRWLKFFKLEEILIIDSSSFFNNTTEELKKVENYLGLENHSYQNEHLISPFQKKASNYPKMPLEIRKKLIIYFEPYVTELKHLCGQNFDWKDFK